MPSSRDHASHPDWLADFYHSALGNVRGSSFSSVTHLNDCLQKAEELSHINAFVTATPEQAKAAATKSDARREAGALLSDIDGLPFAIKDNFCTEGIRSTAGSPVKIQVPSAELASRGTLRIVNLCAFNVSTTLSSASPVGFDHCTSSQPGYLVEPS